MQSDNEDHKFYLMWLLFIFFYFYLVGLCVAQCPDICTEATELNLCNASPGDVVCLPEMCNGNHITGNIINWYCDDENGGNPSGCSSSTSVEHDFWVRLQVCQDWVYTIGFDSDYTNYQYPELSGAQMWIYDECGTLNMIETALCDLETETNLLMDVYLEAGEYVVQVDGYGQSVGCGDFCVYMQGFLGLGVEELTKYNKQGQRIRFNVLGQRVE